MVHSFWRFGELDHEVCRDDPRWAETGLGPDLLASYR